MWLSVCECVCWLAEIMYLLVGKRRTQYRLIYCVSWLECVFSIFFFLSLFIERYSKRRTAQSYGKSMVRSGKQKNTIYMYLFKIYYESFEKSVPSIISSPRERSVSDANTFIATHTQVPCTNDLSLFVFFSQFKFFFFFLWMIWLPGRLIWNKWNDLQTNA